MISNPSSVVINTEFYSLKETLMSDPCTITLALTLRPWMLEELMIALVKKSGYHDISVVDGVIHATKNNDSIPLYDCHEELRYWLSTKPFSKYKYIDGKESDQAIDLVIAKMTEKFGIEKDDLHAKIKSILVQGEKAKDPNYHIYSGINDLGVHGHEIEQYTKYLMIPGSLQGSDDGYTPPDDDDDPEEDDVDFDEVLPDNIPGERVSDYTPFEPHTPNNIGSCGMRITPTEYQ